MDKLNKSLFFILILTIVGSLLTYHIMDKVYAAYNLDFYEANIIKAK